MVLVCDTVSPSPGLVECGKEHLSRSKPSKDNCGDALVFEDCFDEDFRARQGSDGGEQDDSQDGGDGTIVGSVTG